MAKPLKAGTDQIATAQDLATGRSVFRTADGLWCTDVALAEVAREPADTARLLMAAQADAGRQIVVEPALIEVRIAGGAIRPALLREAIRAEGPTAGSSLAPTALPLAANG